MTRLAASDSVDLDAIAQGLQRRVGQRVRAARDRAGMPRRVLSERSGVSPRYIAQLEAGEGNISIGLLMRVAVALDTRLDLLVGDGGPSASGALEVAALFRNADPETQEAVLRLLGAAPENADRAQRICLIGLRGAGKTTLGRRAAAALGVQFLELNKEIEGDGGMAVAEIMALYGQEGYRKLETAALDRVVEGHDRVILAAAGGVVGDPVTYNRLLSRFHTIWIQARPSEHMDRVRAQGDERPMAGNPGAIEELRTILQEREALYDRAGARVDTSGQDEDTSLERLLEVIDKRGFLGK